MLPKSEKAWVPKFKLPQDERQSSDTNDGSPTVKNTYQPTQEPGPSNSNNLNTRPTKRVINYILKKNITLHKAENPWVPNCMTAKVEQQSSDDIDAQIEKTKKTVRSLMNKITEENMVTITENIMSLPINTYSCLTSIIELLFEKAITEPSFAPQYASLCFAMQNVKVLSNDDNMKVSFKSLLLSNCQKMFNYFNIQERKAKKMQLEIESCQDLESKKRLQYDYEQTERRHRQRSVGNSRFMCELYNVKILKPGMLKQCIDHLSKSRKEEQLECLCNIIKIVGRNLDLTTTFQILEEIVLVKNRNIVPTRIRFMIMDTIDLKNNGWVPQNADKMLSEEEIETEISVSDEMTTKTKTNAENENYTRQKKRSYRIENDTSPTIEHTSQSTQEPSPSIAEHLTTKNPEGVIDASHSEDSIMLQSEKAWVPKFKLPQDERPSSDTNDGSPTVKYTDQQTQEQGPSNYEHLTTKTPKSVVDASPSKESIIIHKSEKPCVGFPTTTTTTTFL